MKKIISLICIILMLLPGTSTVAYAAKKDVDPPVVIKMDPDSNATDVRIGQTIVIRFSEAVKSGKSISKIRLSGPNKSYVKFTYAISNNLMFIKPDNDLEMNKKYTITIPAAAVCDASGNDLKYIFQYSFVTEEPKPEDKDVFRWQDSDFVNLPKPDALLTSIVKDDTTQSVMSTFSKMSTQAAASYVTSLKNIGYSGDCDYNDEAGTIFTAKNDNGYAITFTYSSETCEGTLLYQFVGMGNEDDITEETSEDISDNTEPSDDADADEASNASGDSFVEPSIICSNTLIKIPYGSQATVVVAVHGEGTIRIVEGETPRLFFHMENSEYVDDLSMDLQDYEIICINEYPTNIRVTYLSHTDNTITYLIESLQGTSTRGVEIWLQPGTYGNLIRSGFSVAIVR